MAKVTIRIPTPLRSFVDGRAAIDVQASTAREALARLTEANEPLRAQLYGENGELRRFVNVYVGERNLRELSDDEAMLPEGAEIRIVPSIAGGLPTLKAPGAPSGESDVETRETAASPLPSQLSPDELRRYSRHIMIPEVGLEGQQKLKAARVLLVGAGGLGSPLGLYLAAAGVGRLGIVDYDVVDFTNLHRQILHDTAAVGTLKLESARQRLEALNPEVEMVTFETRLDSGNALEIFEGWDLVVDGSDNFPTRYLVNDASVLLGIPTVWGAIFRFEGQVSVFGAADGPCYRCLFREPPPPGLVPSCADAGVLGVLPGIVGTIQATEAIKLILRKGNPLVGRLLLLDAWRMEFREMKIRRDPECPVCGDQPTITELIDYEDFCGAGQVDETEAATPAIEVTELKRRLDAGESFHLIDVREPYEWEICNLEFAGARLIPLGEIEDRLEEISPDDPLIVHCRSGGRSAQAVEYLRSQGFANAVNLTGGVLAWAAEVDPEMPTY